uniref:Uncharacterized protein n=1 Tax=Globodera rostochiensis TaxID=31243 RepID=A0A914GTW8_GLORO
MPGPIGNAYFEARGQATSLASPSRDFCNATMAAERTFEGLRTDRAAAEERFARLATETAEVYAAAG